MQEVKSILLALVVVATTARVGADDRTPRFDVLLQGGAVYDGTGAAGYVADAP